MRRFLLALCFVALATGQQGQQGPKGQKDPCEEYKSFTDEKRSIRYRSSEDEPNICDKDIDEQIWYRFQTLPPQKIHDQCISELKCGTEQPVWIRGTHPTAADPGPREVEVCSPQGNDCCGGWTSTIQVKFCRAHAAGDDDYYVYRLKKLPRCDMAYCSGDADICPKGTVWNPNSKTCTQPHPNIADPIFEGPKIVNRKLINGHTYDDFHFTCNVQWTNPDALKKGEYFEVAFTFNGQEVTSVPPRNINGADLSVKLWSKDIKGQAGKTVGCKVRSYWKMVDVRRSSYHSAQRTYYVGIRYSTTNAEGSFTSPRIEIDERSPPLTLYFRATVPVSCPMTTHGTFCRFTVYMADIAIKDGLGMQECSITFVGLDIDKKLSSTQMIKAQTTPGIMNRASVLRFKPVICNEESFWHQYQLPDIPIIVKDTSTSGICHSTGDPHITTFDTRSTYHVFMEGDFLFAKSTERHFEVHVRHFKCGPTVTCNCAVAVREGNNVLGVNFCGGPHSTPTPITYLRDRNVPGATITLSGNSYTITMPSGAYLRADVIGNSYLNIYLFLTAEDYGKTSGLCGIWNGNKGDDTVPKGTTTNDPTDFPNKFTESYRLRADESFINGHVRPIQCLNIKDLLPNICTCDERRAVTCAPPDDKTTTFVTQFVENCNKGEVPINRRRRDVDSSNETAEEENRKDDMMITEADFPIPKFNETFGVDVTLSWPTASGITKAQAESHCQAKMEGSPVYQMCKERMAPNTKSIVDNCVIDAQAMDNLTVASAYIVSEFQRICVHELEISVVSNGSSAPSEVEVILANVVSMICPNQCNRNGNCQNGACVCNSGFAGEDCSVNARNPPQLSSFRRDIKCDFRSSFCHETSIFASNFFHSEKFKCKITAVDRAKHFTLGGSLVSNGEVMCKLPAVYRFTNETAEGHGPAAEVGPAPFYRWDISLTNDGSLYSNNLRLTVYDSKCQEVRPDGTTTQKADTCVIDGRCYRSGEASSQNRCKKCFPSKSRDSWTHDKTEKVCPSSATAVSYSLSIFLAAILISFFRIDA